jgi:lantibiotic modifying enzyme
MKIEETYIAIAKIVKKQNIKIKFTLAKTNSDNYSYLKNINAYKPKNKRS